MRAIPYKLRTDAWWLGDDFTWRRQLVQAPLDPDNGCMISDRDFGNISTADAYSEQHPNRR